MVSVMPDNRDRPWFPVGNYIDADGIGWRCVESGFPGKWELEAQYAEWTEHHDPPRPKLPNMLGQKAAAPHSSDINFFVFQECGRSRFPGCWHLIDLFTVEVRDGFYLPRGGFKHENE